MCFHILPPIMHHPRKYDEKYSFVKNLFTGREIRCALNCDLEKGVKTKENEIYVVQMEKLYILVKI